MSASRVGPSRPSRPGLIEAETTDASNVALIEPFPAFEAGPH